MTTNPPEGPARPGAALAPSGTGEGTLRGLVERVTYQHPDSGYSVLRIALDPDECAPGELFSPRERFVHAVGIAGEVSAGERIHLEGEWRIHPRHGPQFQFRVLKVLPPLGREGLVRFLASRNFRGIGPKLAERIVDELGPDALGRIDQRPELLRGVRGLRKEARENLVTGLRAQRSERQLQAFLYGLELSSSQVLEATRSLGADSEARIRANPFLLSRSVRGVGFASADRAARRLGLAEDSPERRQAALAFVLEQAASEGHSCLDEESLRGRAQEVLGGPLEPDAASAALGELERMGEVILERELLPGTTLVYPPAVAASETALARNLSQLLSSAPVRDLCDPDRLRVAERAAGLELHPSQREAVRGCLRSPVCLLTGGPGVGKTTIVRLVVELAERAGLGVVLASPTGRAAKRLSEATGRPASTVHRLLGWDPSAHRFEHHGGNPLGAELVIVDEISMLDVILAHHLVKALQPPTRLVLVGDPDQLPSVSAGNVLADLLDSGCVPVQRLEQVFRQDSDSLIVENAHRILQGDLPRTLSRDDPIGDFYFFPADDDESTAERLVEVVTQRIPQRFGLDWVNDVQVLAPMYRGPCGVDLLNDRLRSALASGGSELRWRERTWRVGDRVIQTRNDYEKQVFNGDMGRIVRVDKEKLALTVRFPERAVDYATDELTDLSCAFAVTVHRSQGGEFPAVVLPLVTQHWPMLQRNLLYTAITRARRLVVLIGSQRALRRAVENSRPSERQSGLAPRLRAATSLPGKH